MIAAVRYYSRSGNTKAVAEAIARAAGVEAVQTDSADAGIWEYTDVLFVGGALYAYGIDSHLKEWLEALDGEKTGRAVVFSTSWLSRHAIDLIKKELKAKGIETAEEAFYVRGKPGEAQLREAQAFAEKYL